MQKLPIVFGSLALTAALLTGSSYGQDKKGDVKKDAVKDAKEVQPGPNVFLPPGWGKLGITTDQKKKIYAVLGSYQIRISDLEEKLDALKKERLTEAVKLLNDDQKAQLRRMADEKAGLGKDTKDDKDKGKDKAKDKDKDKGGS